MDKWQPRLEVTAQEWDLAQRVLRLHRLELRLCSALEAHSMLQLKLRLVHSSWTKLTKAEQLAMTALLKELARIGKLEKAEAKQAKSAKKAAEILAAQDALRAQQQERERLDKLRAEEEEAAPARERPPPSPESESEGEEEEEEGEQEEPGRGSPGAPVGSVRRFLEDVADEASSGEESSGDDSEGEDVAFIATPFETRYRRMTVSPSEDDED